MLNDHLGSGAEISGNGLKIIDEAAVLCLGVVRIGNGVSAGDLIHAIISEDSNNRTWHGQCVAAGMYDSFSITANIRFIQPGTILYPWVMCQQGYNHNYLDKESTFTFVII